MTSDTTRRTIIPIYTTKGDVEAFLVYPNIFNRLGEWIGWVNEKREVYSVVGEYVGYITNDPRILRAHAMEALKPRLNPPPTPKRISIPAHAPLAPMMSDIAFSTIDVLQDEPERLHTIDGGEFRQDMD
jgi:hypothetical protein